MEKVLSQSEIDALFRVARGGGPSQAPPPLQIERWDLQQAGVLDKEQLQSISQLHETFARNLGSAVGGYLREKFEVALVAVEQLAYRDFLARFSDVTYYATFCVLPGDARGMFHLDLSLAFPIIDILLGGAGSVLSTSREVSDIEEHVLEDFGHVVCHELGLVAGLLGMQVKLEGRQPVSQMLRILPPEEKTLTLTFDVNMTDAKGMLNIAFPSALSSALIRKLRAELVYQRARGAPVHQQRIGSRLLRSTAGIELATPAIPLRLRELLTLKPGSVLALNRRIDEPAMLRIRGRECWSARPVSSRAVRAAQLMQPLEPSTEEEA